MNPLAYLSRWSTARTKRSPFYGVHRSVATESVRWNDPRPPIALDDVLCKLRDALPVYRPPLLPPGWTMTECGALPPGWTVERGRPVRSEGK